MNSKMKKLSLAALAGATALVSGQFANAALTVTSVRTAGQSINGGLYDLVDFYLTGVDGVDTKAGTLSSTGGVLGLNGTFTDSLAGGLAVPGSDATYATYIIAGGDASLPAGYDSSLVNLDSLVGGSNSRTGAVIAGTTTKSGTKISKVGGTYTTLGGTWFTTSAAIVADPATDGTQANNNLIAQMFVTPGSTVGFSGQYTTYGTNGGAINFSTGSVVTTATGHAIISLTAGVAPAVGYLPADGTITMVGSAQAGYPVTPAAGFTTATTGSVAVTGFDATSTEIYALKLSIGGTDAAGTGADTRIASIISDINSGANGAAVGVTASAVTGVYTNLFAGYDILLTSKAGFTPTGGASLGFDFTQETATPGITVTGVAAVPEPATAAGVVLGAAGLLLGRRKNRAMAA